METVTYFLKPPVHRRSELLTTLALLEIPFYFTPLSITAEVPLDRCATLETFLRLYRAPAHHDEMSSRSIRDEAHETAVSKCISIKANGPLVELISWGKLIKVFRSPDFNSSEDMWTNILEYLNNGCS